MNEVEITFLRALKVWWSWIWRTWVFMMVIYFAVLVIGLILYFAFRSSFASSNPSEYGWMLYVGIGLGYLILIPGLIILQIYILQLALKVQWSDFRLVAIAVPRPVYGAPVVPAAPAPTSPPSDPGANSP